MYIPESTNLSAAWGELFLRLMERGIDELSPVSISVNEFEEDGTPRELRVVRDSLDAQLRTITGVKNRPLNTNDVASTIFPYSLWNREKKDDGKHLFERYENILPKIKARDSRNRRGTYFQRLTRFVPLREDDEPINQLRHVIKTYKSGNHRRSALQAATFDPRFDHNNAPMMGFPCLQQIAFAPTSAGLSISAFYPVQYVFERAYGNYLGLCWLGLFMAQQLEMPFAGMNCFINVAQLGAVHKADLRQFGEKLRGLLRK